jgi:hypothetical protein
VAASLQASRPRTQTNRGAGRRARLVHHLRRHRRQCGAFAGGCRAMMQRSPRRTKKAPARTSNQGVQLKIQLKDAGTLDEHEKDYLAYIGKFIIEFSKAEHNLDEAIMLALKYDRKRITTLSRNFPPTMKDKLFLMIQFCESEATLGKYTLHLQNRLNELTSAMTLRNALCHGYLELVKREAGDVEFKFTRWTRGDEKYHIKNVSHLPKLSQIKKSTKAIYIWKVLFAELERAVGRLIKPNSESAPA